MVEEGKRLLGWQNIIIYQSAIFSYQSKVGSIKACILKRAGSMQVRLAQLSRISLSQWNNAYV